MYFRNALIVMIVLAAIALSGCRSKRMNIPQAPAPAPRGTITDAVDSEPILPVLPAPREPETPVVEEVPAPVPMREERFTFAEDVDRVVHDPNLYFVILGSFRSPENANRFKDALADQGFEPVILISESGLHRVSIDSFTDEIVARTRVNRIRNNYPEYQDAWLLIRKR